MARLAIFIILAITTFPLCAEGIKEATGGIPTAFGGIILKDFPNTSFRYDRPDGYQLRVRVRTASERVHLGFEVNTDNYAALRDYADVSENVSDVWVRVRRASDNSIVVAGTQLMPGQPGWIANMAQAYAGPAAVVGAAGYNGLVFTPPAAGDYIIEFARDNDPTWPSNFRRIARLWDITVHYSAVPGAAGIRNGRVYSKAWPFNTYWVWQGGAHHFRGSLYPYSSDSVVTRIEFNQFDPFGFVVSCNAYGVRNDLDFTQNRQSNYQTALLADGVEPGLPDYPIFLNDPDPIEFPSGIVGELTGVTVQPCSNQDYCINVAVSNVGNISVRIDFPNGTRRDFLEPVVAGVNCISWDGRDGNGDLVPNGALLDITVGYLTGLTHLPLLDVENSGGFTVSLVRPATTPGGTPLSPPLLYWDDALITTGVVGDNLVQLGGVSGPAHTFFDRGQFGTEEWINTWWYANQSTLQVPFTIDSASWLVTGVLELPDVCNVDDKINMHVRFRNNQIALGSVSYAFSTNYPAFVTLAAVDTVTVVDTTFIFVEYNVDPSLSLQPTPIVFQWTVQASSAQFPTCNSVNNASCEVMATVLPLEAVTLSGRRMANAAHLHWQVQNEQQVQHYTLLRASGTRASSFEVVGHTPAIGQAHYGYIDTQLPAGNHYYRLQYTDADGAVGMANETVWISIGTDDIPDLAFAQSNHKLSLQDPEQLADITVWDLSGKQILSCRACNHLSTQSLAHGAYVATALEKSGKLATRRFTVMAR